MIEVVLNSDTIDKIHTDHGGAFSKSTLINYLEKYNSKNEKRDRQSDFDIAVENFLRSYFYLYSLTRKIIAIKFFILMK